MTVIGISGKAGAGKDTIADYLVGKYGYKKISFAHTLKNMLKVAGLEEPANREDKEKNFEGFPFNFREAAQKLGTEWGRSLDEDIWVKLTMKGLQEGCNYVVSDVRFHNEAEAVRDSGEVWHVKGRSANLGVLSEHVSEQGIKAYYEDIEVDNSGSVSSLYKQIDRNMEKIGCVTIN